MQGLRANEVVAAAFEDIFIVRSEKAFKDDPEKMWSMFIEDDTRKCRDVSKASMFIIFICARRLEDRARHKKQECLRTFKSSCNAINDRSFTRAHYISYQPLPCKGSATCVAIIDRFDLILPARNSVQATVAIHGANCSEMRLVIFELIESQKGNFFKVYTTSKNVMYTQPCT